jgi:dihydrofolate reductase
MITSLDGYAIDAEGGFDFMEVGEDEHDFFGEQLRSVGTFLYGRRMYETMVFWETAHAEPDAPPFIVQFARDWQAAEKVVYSTTLASVTGARTTIERTFDPERIRQLKAGAERDISVGGPGLAARAIKGALVDEFHLFVMPVVVGGGTRALPDDVHVALELLAERRFANGTVHLHYRVT